MLTSSGSATAVTPAAGHRSKRVFLWHSARQAPTGAFFFWLDGRPRATAFIRLSMFVRAGRPSTSCSHCNKTIVPVQVYFSVRLGSAAQHVDHRQGRWARVRWQGDIPHRAEACAIGASHSERDAAGARRATCRRPGAPPRPATASTGASKRKSPNPRGRGEGTHMARRPGIRF